jgi:phage-related protein
MIINPQLQQQNEDLYGNEIKRRRVNYDAGHHLKVWRQQIVVVLDEEKEEEDVVHVVHVVQEPIQVKEEEPQVQVVQAEEQVPAQAEEQVQVVPVQFIGRIVMIETTCQRIHRGRIQSLFELNGERAIHIETSDGENLIFRVSQMCDLKILHEDGDRDHQELSPIPRCDEEEVVQIDDDDEDVLQITQRMEVVQIDSDSDDDNEEQEQDEQDDFPDTPFQPARRPNHSEEEEEEPNCCAICLDITDATRNFVSLDCGHQFHFACIMGNMANGGNNRNQCPMCRSDVLQEYDVDNMDVRIDEMVENAARSNQRLQDELNQTRQYREDLTAEYVRTMSMNMQIGIRHAEEREARDALERRAYICRLNERIATVVSSACNNDVRHNPSAAVHLERQMRELCMCFGMTAYDAQYDQEQYDQEQYDQEQYDQEQAAQAEYQEESDSDEM